MANKENCIWGEEFDVTVSVVILVFSVDLAVVVVEDEDDDVVSVVVEVGSCWSDCWCSCWCRCELTKKYI